MRKVGACPSRPDIRAGGSEAARALLARAAVSAPAGFAGTGAREAVRQWPASSYELREGWAAWASLGGSRIGPLVLPRTAWAVGLVSPSGTALGMAAPQASVRTALRLRLTLLSLRPCPVAGHVGRMLLQRVVQGSAAC